MKRKLGLIGVLYAAILAAIAGYFFRTAQLSGGSSVPVVAFSVLMVLVFALAAVSLEKHAAYAEVYSPCRQDLAFSLLGAAGLIAGCALDFRGSVFRMLISLLGRGVACRFRLFVGDLNVLVAFIAAFVGGFGLLSVN